VPKPELRTFSAEHPIVMVYSGCTAFDWITDSPALTSAQLDGDPLPRRGRILGSLGTRAIAGQAAKSATSALLLADQISPTCLVIDRVWRPDEWADLSFDDLWPVLGGPRIGSRDLWLDRTYADGTTGLGPVAQLAAGAKLDLPDDVLLPGVYVIPAGAMHDVPMVANNRAHSFEGAATKRLLVDARSAGLYTAFPTWFAHFAEAQPPNLYAKQREQYETLFAARRR